ncbi:MAG TPA: SDR family oxidoreductase [Oligoflexus sp.]|uniref:SDR family oxidoreductase n=1 Tax=Oligoflexus sp. TaxID=1971216 RepID=UPI002D7EBF71|nr:SDR family oxidoreductase [Oligoflexus sp.]HET9241288.1 SDR family oxidoreductase [Oligoflexus sp.]
MESSADKEVVVITGASAGVGRATARAFGQRGASVALIARNEKRLEQTKAEIEQAGGEALVLPLDVSDAQSMDEAAETVMRTFGKIDVWVNNAMVSVFSPVKETSAEEFRRVTEVTYLGYVHGTLAALRHMLPRNKGTIVQVGSALAYRGIPLQAAYCGAKHAIQGFTESLRAELYHDKSNVWVTMVQMPALNTPQFAWSRSRMPHKAQPVPPIYQPEVAAEAIVWSAHHRRRQLSVGLSTSIVIHGNKIAPGFGDHYLGWTGYASQQRPELRDPNRPDNLFESVAGDYAAHGDFDTRAHGSSPQLWMNTHRSMMLGVGLGAAALGYLFSRNHSH